MRELTWREKIIDAKTHFSISKWCNAIEDAINALKDYEIDDECNGIDIMVQPDMEENIDISYYGFEKGLRFLQVKIARNLPELNKKCVTDIIEHIAESEGIDDIQIEADAIWFDVDL